MDLHRIIVFFHVAAMVGLFAAMVIEWVSVAGLRRSRSYEQARDWAGLWRLLTPIGAPSILTVLASGIYLATTLGVWKVGWVGAALPTLIVIAIAGGVAGPRRKRIPAAIDARSGPMPHDVLMQLRHPLLIASIRARAALIAALVFAMTARPALSAAALIGWAVALGGVAGASAWRGTRAATMREDRAASGRL